MDNFRSPRRPVTRGRSIDGFSARSSVKQTPQITPVSPAATPVSSNFLGSHALQPVVELQPVTPVTFAQHPVTSELLPQTVPTAVVAAAPEELAPAPVSEPLTAEAAAPVTPPSGQLSPFDLYSIEETDKPINRLNPRKAFKTWLLRGGLVALVLLIGIGGLLFAQGYGKVHKVFKGTATQSAALQTDVDVSKLKGEGDGRINILLLGNGGGNHDAPDLTDTLIIESIDPVNKKAVLFSVPRDLWVNVPGYNAMKLNAVFEVGKYNAAHKIDNTNNDAKAVQAGFDLIDKQIQTVLGIPIHYNALVNFAAFKQAIDAVGGVNVNVPEALVDPSMAWENGRNPVLAPAGPQLMDGTKALLYARSRHTSSDFARSQRQRSLLLALKDKVLTAGTLSNPVKLSQLMSSFGNNMVTDFSLADATRAYQLMKDIDNKNIQSMDLVTAPNALVTTATLNGVSVGIPKAGTFEYGEIQNFVRSGLKDGFLTNENAQISLLNGSQREGYAATKANELKSYGYNVTTVGNAPTRAYATTVIVDYTNGAKKVTRQYLENRYGVKAVSAAPDPAIQRGTADFVIILGAN